MDTNNKEQIFDHEDNDLNVDNLANEQEVDADESEKNDNLADDLEKKFGDLNDSFLRLHAEYDNYRKRTIKEKADLIKSGGEKTILSFLPIIDDFERALPNIPEDAKEGFELIYNKFKNTLIQNGVKEIDPIGDKFDVDLHEAITTVPSQDENQKDTIIDCIQKGYSLNDKVIRFPKVIVAK